MAEENYVVFDDRTFIFRCGIKTVDGGYIPLTQSVILNLEIRESIFTGFPEGVLLIDNNGNGIDGSIIFEGNNFTNLLELRIVPVEDRGGKKKKIVEGDNYEINDIFAIYNIIDEPVGEYPQLAKKIFFRQLAANELIYKKNSFTAADFFSGEDISNLSNNERAVKTGEILKKIFNEENKDKGEEERSAGFTISNDWDLGKHSIFPNWCPGTETLYDTAQKVYMKHVSEEAPHDRCYFKYDRFKKELSLISMYKLLMKNVEDPKNYFLETLVMGTLGNTNTTNTSTREFDKAEVSRVNILPDLSQIRAFRLKDLRAEVLEKELNIVIPATTDFDNTSRFNLGEKNIKDIHNKFYKKYYVEDPFKKSVKDGKPKPMLTWENTRRKINTRYNKILNAPYKSWDHAYDVEVHAGLLNTLLFDGSLNGTISLRGATHRTVGKFIDILIMTEPTLHFAKTPGRWLITECTHIFTKDKYWNSLNCIKTYRNF